ncbi:MAG TPA: hypothetical protein DCE42_25495, partial [Myxococcales bacterium]|nr:hypothetical protein [Myxococcales bacterium]
LLAKEPQEQYKPTSGAAQAAPTPNETKYLVCTFTPPYISKVKPGCKHEHNEKQGDRPQLARHPSIKGKSLLTSTLYHHWGCDRNCTEG